MNAEYFDIVTPLIRLFWKAQGYHTFKVMDWWGIKKNNDGWLGIRPDSRWIVDTFGEYDIKARCVQVEGDYLVFHIERERAEWAEYILCSAGLAELFGVPLIDEGNRKAGENRAVKGIPRSWKMQERDRTDSHARYTSLWGHLYRLFARSHTLTGWVNMAEYTTQEFNDQQVVPSRTRYRTEPLPTQRLGDKEHYARVASNLTKGKAYQPFWSGDDRDISPDSFREMHHASSITSGKPPRAKTPAKTPQPKPKHKPVSPINPPQKRSLLTRIKNG